MHIMLGTGLGLMVVAGFDALSSRTGGRGGLVWTHKSASLQSARPESRVWTPDRQAESNASYAGHWAGVDGRGWI